MQVFQGYRKTLSPLQIQIYDSLKSGISRHLKEIIVPQCSDEALKDIFESVLLDYPEIFYTKGYRALKNQNSQIIVMPSYTHSSREIKMISEDCRKQAEHLIKDAYTLNDYAKELFIHDLLLGITYGDGHKPEAHSIIGPLLRGVGVCEGISKTAKFLFDMLNINSMVVFGVAKTPKGRKDEAHAWNCINIDETWYHLDITFDNSLSTNIKRYDYFNLSDYEIEADHKATKHLWARCAVQQSYYYKNDAVVETKQQLMKMLTKGDKDIIVKFPFSKETAYQMIRETLSELKVKEAGISCNPHQMVFHIMLRENN